MLQQRFLNVNCRGIGTRSNMKPSQTQQCQSHLKINTNVYSTSWNQGEGIAPVSTATPQFIFVLNYGLHLHLVDEKSSSNLYAIKNKESINVKTVDEMSIKKLINQGNKTSKHIWGTVQPYKHNHWIYTLSTAQFQLFFFNLKASTNYLNNSLKSSLAQFNRLAPNLDTM